MNIYLACTVRGDRAAIGTARALAHAIEDLGHTILTRHLLEDDVDSREGALTEREVFERDLRWLEASDLLIAEGSGSSYGVGFEVGYVIGRAERTGPRVLLLYDVNRRPLVSRLIAGNTHPACTTYPYRRAEDLLQFVRVYLAERPHVDAGRTRPSAAQPPLKLRRVRRSLRRRRKVSAGALMRDIVASASAPAGGSMSRVTTVVCTILVAAVSLVLGAQQPQDQKPDPQRPPTFRSGAHFVSVDAYPVRDGKPLSGLTVDDFILLEDGKPQAIDRIEFIEHQQFTPLAERRDPNSQRDGFELARNPNYRVFVLYLDAFHVDFSGSHAVRVPITDLLNRMMGPQDLFGIMTPLLGIKDLLLGQSTLSIQEQLEKYPQWGLISQQPLPEELELDAAGYGSLIPIKRLDKVYSDLEALVDKLGSLRDERKNIIFFSDTLPSPRPGFNAIASDPDPYRKGSRPPEIGVNDKGKLSMDRPNDSEPNARAMREEKNRLSSIDFDQRFRDLLSSARQANVSFYTVRPGGLDMQSSMLVQGTSNLAVLAEQTDGLPVLATNDLWGGMRKIADDLSSHYVLGFYTNNTRWDGRARKLTVKLKSTGQTIRARREYRAPTEEEMAGLRTATGAAGAATAPPSAGQVALSALSRVSPSSRLNAYGTVIGTEAAIVAEISAAEIESGRWKQGADVDVLFSSKSGGEPVGLKARIEPGTRSALVRVPTESSPGPWQAVVRMRGEDNTTDSDTVSIEKPAGTLLGKPLAYRAASAAASAYKPLAAFQFRRTERVRVEWPTTQPLETHSARLLDRAGKPMAIPLETTTKDAGGVTMLTTTLNLAPFSNGDYLIEVSAKTGEKTETQTVAIRVSMAR